MFEKQRRQSITVDLYYNRDARKLHKYGDIIYHSRKWRYLVLYTDADLVDTTVEEIRALKYVRDVRPSQYLAIDREFVGNLERYPAHVKEHG